MSGSCFAEILGELVALTSVEQATLARLEERQRHIRRGAILQREKEASSELFILRRGLMMSYVLLDDGSRQILRFLFPGDMLGLPGMIYRDAPETIAALTDCVVCPFDRTALAEIVTRQPRLAALIMAYCQVERVSLTDRLAALGRTSAKARVSALLLELRDRLRTTDKTITDSYPLGLTQEEIGDATGLTSVHVNRMLRQLEDDGVIVRNSGRVSILSEDALVREANYVNRYTGFDVGWLPPPMD